MSTQNSKQRNQKIVLELASLPGNSEFISINEASHERINFVGPLKTYVQIVKLDCLDGLPIT